jgi:organic hydroperoxide reductase OsmC/OhrA
MIQVSGLVLVTDPDHPAAGWLGLGWEHLNGRLPMKTYEIPTKMKWKGKRRGVVEVEGKKPLEIAAPPEFKGPNGIWTPEDLFVAALESCLMLTFISLCEDEKLELISYSSTASGRLEKSPEGLSFGWVVISPQIEARGPEEETLKLIHKASDLCMVRRSVSCKVAIYPEVTRPVD